jgi:hypothetical protein
MQMSNERTMRTEVPGGGARAGELAVACRPSALPKEQRVSHLELSRQAVLHSPARRVELEDGFRFEYRGDEERFAALARWVAAEHRCCPWASYSVAMLPFADGDGQIQVTVTATPEGKAFLATAYAYLEQLRDAAPPASIMDSSGKLTRDTLLARLLRGCGC